MNRTTIAQLQAQANILGKQFGFNEVKVYPNSVGTGWDIVTPKNLRIMGMRGTITECYNQVYNTIEFVRHMQNIGRLPKIE